MAITPLLFAYWFAVRQRWGWYAASAMLAVAWKEEVALAVAVLGVVLAVRGHRRIGLITAAAALGWFLFAIRLLIPEVGGADPFYISFFSSFGNTLPEVLRNVLTHPRTVWNRVTSPEALRYLGQLAAPFAFVPLLAPAVLAFAVPQVLVNLLSNNTFTRSITFHYAAVPLSALILATVEGIGRDAQRPAVRGILVGLVLATALLATVSWGPSPLGVDNGRFWPSSGDPRRHAKQAALAVIPDRAAVSASYRFVPHLTHRYGIYEFPNPFVPSNWGDENYPSPNAAHWLIVDRQAVGEEFRPLLDELLASGEFRTVFDEDDIVVANRAGALGQLAGLAVARTSD